MSNPKGTISPTRPAATTPPRPSQPLPEPSARAVADATLLSMASSLERLVAQQAEMIDLLREMSRASKPYNPIDFRESIYGPGGSERTTGPT